MHAPRWRSLLVAAVVAAPLVGPPPATGQAVQGGSGFRVGVAFGGISRYSLVAEYVSGAYGVDLNLGTWRFGDLSLSAVAKRYFRGSTPNPYVGAGIWLITARPADSRRGFAAVLRVPVGIDWRATGRHHVGASANLNRALLVRRTDPLDERPVKSRIIPLPGLYYRYDLSR